MELSTRGYPNGDTDDYAEKTTAPPEILSDSYYYEIDICFYERLR